VGKPLLFPLLHILVSNLNSWGTGSLPMQTHISFKRAAKLDSTAETWANRASVTVPLCRSPKGEKHSAKRPTSVLMLAFLT